MYIYGKTRMDKSGRILLTDFFSPEEPPKSIVLAVDVGLQQIFVNKDDRRSEFGASIPLDEKNRAIIPRWLRQELKPHLNEGRELFFIIEGDKRYLSPKSGSIF